MNVRSLTVTILVAILCVGAAGVGLRALRSSPKAHLPAAAAGPGKTSTDYPIYSSAFTGNTPFHHTVAQLMAAGAKVVSNSQNRMAVNYMSQGVAKNQPLRLVGGGNVGPLYTGQAADPAYIFSCPAYGKCNAAGKTVHYPAGAEARADSDHHLSTIDFASHSEIDGWGGFTPNGVSGPCDVSLTPTASCPYPCNLSPGSPGSPGIVNCSWGGYFALSGSGLATATGDAGNAGGYAFGIMMITAGEVLRGHIDHALGITQSCLDPNTVYPSHHPGTDSRCSGSATPFSNNFNEPQPSYGHLIHLKSTVDVTTLAGSVSCRTILTAFQKYGAYTADNNGRYGIALNIEDAVDQYGGNAPTNPWFTKILPEMAAHGDATENRDENSPFIYNTCLGNVTANDIEVIRISTTLPPM